MRIRSLPIHFLITTNNLTHKCYNLNKNKKKSKTKKIKKQTSIGEIKKQTSIGDGNILPKHTTNGLNDNPNKAGWWSGSVT